MTDLGPPSLCRRCAAPLVNISFRQGSSNMTMSSCAKCHRRTWQRDDEAVELGDVLSTLAQSRRRRKRAGR
ncbi:MAG TPA: hypothetical protein VNT56_05670 [Acidimicrobiales bacterium]|nr:hypothetical protein [Acidimicrobiales bacterium]